MAIIGENIFRICGYERALKSRTVEEEPEMQFFSLIADGLNLILLFFIISRSAY